MINLLKVLISIPNTKTGIFYFLLFTLLAAVLELLGIGLIFPLFSVISEKSNFSIPTFLLDYDLSQNETIIFFALSLLLVYLAKNIYLLFFSWWRNKFTQSIYKDSSVILLKKYLSQNYNFFCLTNSSTLTQNVFVETKHFSGTVNAGLNLIVEIIVLLSITIFLVFLKPLMTIAIVTVILFFSLTYIKIFKKKLNFLGYERRKQNTYQLQRIKEAFDGIKIIKLYGLEGEFLKKYNFHIDKLSKVSATHLTLNDVPKIWLEVFAIMTISFMIIYLSLVGSSYVQIIPIIAVFAGAAFRILPSINRIIISYQNVTFYKNTVELLQKQYNSNIEFHDKITSDKLLNFDNKINIKNLNFKFGNSDHYFFKNLNLKINKYDCIGIIGKSGSGKTTLIDIIMGLQPFENGTIEVDDVKINDKKNLRSWQNNIGYVSQSTFLIEDTIRKNIALGIPEEKIDDDKVLQSLKHAQLNEYLNRTQNGIHEKISERGINLSMGEQQRFGIARALYNEPQIIILDEPTSALDSNTENDFLNFLQTIKSKKTLILVSHRIKNMKICNRIFQIENFDKHLRKASEISKKIE